MGIINSTNHDELIEIIDNGLLDKLKILLSNTPAILHIRIGKNGHTLLQEVVSKRQLNMTKYLIEEKGADINELDNNGENALYYSSRTDDLTLTKYLVGKGGNLDIRNNYGESVLHSSIKNLTIFIYFIEECRISYDIEDNHGDNLLQYATRLGKIETVKYLIENKKYNHLIDDDNKDNLLHIAVRNEHIGMIKYLVKNVNSDLNSQNNEGKTPLHIAVANQSLVIVKYLLETGKYNSNLKDNNGYTLLHLAGRLENLEIFKYLVEKGFDPYNKYRKNRTCFDCVGNINKRRELEQWFINKPKNIR